MMLVRRCLRQVLFTFVNCNWDLEYMNKFNEVLYRALKSFTLSLRTHLQEIFLEELAKVSILLYRVHLESIFCFIFLLR